MTDIAGFWSKVDLTRGMASCWEWQGYRDRLGYGRVHMGGRHLKAYRVSYELVVGPIPTNLTIDHLCRNSSCVNPAHLEAVTKRENTLRGLTIPARHAAKTHCIHGHPFSATNTYIAWRRGTPHRVCRICNYAAGVRYRARLRHHPEGQDEELVATI